MTRLDGFELLREQAIPELRTRAQLYHHLGTGAELLALLNDDENKTFGVAFRTPPADDAGAPHILEHSTLAGSASFPVKEPFIELVKGSLATYINAFTRPDSTVYPVSSQNLTDLHNLMEVYLDAVFHPLLTRHTFEREGWHYELQQVDGPLTYRGIVFNEMKGNYATPETIQLHETLGALFPDTIYSRDSGGHPQHIPDLTYEQLCAYHAAFYHPSNALFLLYGNLPLDGCLERIGRVLRDYQAIRADAAVALQPRFDAPRARVAYYPVGGGPASHKAWVTVSWMLGSADDPVRVLALDVLYEALLGSPAAPLHKALLDARLGEDLTGIPDIRARQLTFSAGLKGVAPEDAERVAPLILDTLSALARDGVASEALEAALNTIEFYLRENSAGGGQRGIALFGRALYTWLHGGDPLALVAFEAPLAAVKAGWRADPRYFEKLIRTSLLDNPHRVTLTLQPDSELRQRQEAAEGERLAGARAEMSPGELLAVVENTRALQALQETPDSAEALATLPRLRRTDLGREVPRIPADLDEEHGVRLLVHPLATNGIVYLDLGLNLRVLSAEDLPYAAILAPALLEMGTHAEDYVRLTQRIGRNTGGIHPELFASAAWGGRPGPVWLLLRGKAMAGKSDELLSILRDVLLGVNLNDRERLRQIVLREKAQTEAHLLPGGTQYATQRLRAHFSEEDWANDRLNGLGALAFVRQLAQDIESDWDSVLARLRAVHATLLNRNSMLANVTLDGDAWPGLRTNLAAVLAELPAAPAAVTRWTPGALAANEGFSAPTRVNYVAQGANLYAAGYALHGSAWVVNRYLRTTWLWDKIRLQGGAYGAASLLDHLSGVFSYTSYRDPRLLETLADFGGTSDFLRRLALDEAELTRAIVGAIGALDAYQLPDAKGLTSLVRYLTGMDDALRQRLRDEVLATTPAHFGAFADALEVVQREGQVVILSSAEALEAANDRRGGEWLSITRAL
jgi:presequence protease